MGVVRETSPSKGPPDPTANLTWPSICAPVLCQISEKVGL